MTPDPHEASAAQFSLRRIPVTVCITLLIIGVYVAQLLNGVHWLEPATDDILAWGGNLAVYTLTGDHWRLLTSMFLHVGLFHLFMNAYMLITFGPLAERHFGSLNYLAIYLVSGLAGGLASALWHGSRTVVPTSDLYRSMFAQTETIQLIVCAGASGALMGLAGACFIGRMLSESQHDDAENKRINSAIGQVILLNVGLGFFIPGIDQAAHLGGLAAGAVLGALCAFGLRLEGSFARAAAACVLGVAGVAAVIAAVPLGKSDQLVEIRAQLESERQAKVAEKAAANAAEEAKIMAAVDERNAPSPVSAQESGGTFVKTGKSPTDFVLSADGARLYVTHIDDNRLVVLDALNGKVVKTIEGGAFSRNPSSGCRDNYCRGLGATSVAVRRDEKFAYVTSMVADALAVVDLSSNTVVGSVPVGRFPRYVSLSPDQSRAYVFSVVDQTVAVVDLAKLQTIGEPMKFRAPVVDRPFGVPAAMWLSADGTRLWAYAGFMESLEVFDTASGKSLGGPALSGLAAPTLSPDGKQLWAMDETGLQVRDAAGFKSIQHRPYCAWDAQPRALAVNAGGDALAMASSGQGTVQLIKLPTLRTVGLYALNDQPGKLQFSRDGKTLYALVKGEEGGVAFVDPAKSMDVKAMLGDRPEVLCFAAKRERNYGGQGLR